MANEGTPSGKKDEKITIKDAAGGKRELDLSAFAEKLAPMLKDPADEFVTTEATRPDAAAQTPGPHRYTVYVPSDDKTILNLGTSVDGWDTGITGATLSTVHFATTGLFKTSLSLGAAAASGMSANKLTNGFAVTTDGFSFQRAAGPIVSWSDNAGITLQAMQDVQLVSSAGGLSGTFKSGIALSTPGNVTITAGEAPSFDWSPGAVVGGAVLAVSDLVDFANPLVGGDPMAAATDLSNTVANSWGEFLGGKSTANREYVIAKAGTIIDKMLLHAATVTSLIATGRKNHKVGSNGERGWTVWNGASLALQWLSEGLKFYQDFGKPRLNPDTPNLSIKSTGTIEIASDKSAALIAPGGVAISGFKSVDVSSLAVGVKGHKDASVFGGVTASLKALVRDVTVQSDYGGVVVGGMKAVKVASEESDVLVTAKTLVQMTGEGAFVSGESRVVMTVGANHGLVMTPTELGLGELSGGSKFGDATVGGKNQITMNQQGVTVKGANGAMTGEVRVGMGVNVHGNTFDIDSKGKISLKARSKILLA